MSKPDLATLNTMQLVLRGLTQSIAAAGLVDAQKMTYLLQSFAVSHTQGKDPYAHQMLLDLAEGMDILAQATHQTSAN